GISAAAVGAAVRTRTSMPSSQSRRRRLQGMAGFLVKRLSDDRAAANGGLISGCSGQARKAAYNVCSVRRLRKLFTAIVPPTQNSLRQRTASRQMDKPTAAEWPK